MPAPAPSQVAPGIHRCTVGRGVLASNVYLVRRGPAWVLVDAGWAGSGAAIRQAARSLFGPAAGPAAILLTHIHPDHSGAAGELARHWRVPVYVHPDELPMAPGRYVPEYSVPLDRWVVMPVLKLVPPGTRARIAAAGSLTDVVRPLPPDGRVPGLPEWEWVPTPGHTPGHVAYRRPSDGLLVTGDAVLTVDLNSVTGLLGRRQRLGGPPWYTTWDRERARRSISTVAALQPRVLAPGHGEPCSPGTGQALRELARAGGRDQGRRGRWGLRRPLADSGSGRYRPPPALYARLQWLGFALTALGLSPRYVVTLEVPGRTSGRIRRTNLVQVELGGERFLVSVAGESQWVRNVRAAGGRAVVGRRGRRWAVTLVEVPPPDCPAVIRAYLHRPGRRPGTAKVAREARHFFGVSAALTAEELAAAAHRHPVFRVVPTAAAESSGPGRHDPPGRTSPARRPHAR